MSKTRLGARERRLLEYLHECHALGFHPGRDHIAKQLEIPAKRVERTMLLMCGAGQLELVTEGGRGVANEWKVLEPVKAPHAWKDDARLTVETRVERFLSAADAVGFTVGRPHIAEVLGVSDWSVRKALQKAWTALEEGVK